jgi:hypothetical protein
MDSFTPTIRPELLEELLESTKTPEDVFGPDGILHRLKGALMERMLEAEMADHLGFEANDPEGRGKGNSRNGHTGKVVQTETGPVPIRVPRDRNGTFEPKLARWATPHLPPLPEPPLPPPGIAPAGLAPAGRGRVPRALLRSETTAGC